MKKLMFTLILLSSLASCGKRVSRVENPYNDAEIRTLIAVQATKIEALQRELAALLAEYSRDMDAIIEVNERLETELALLKARTTTLENKVNGLVTQDELNEVMDLLEVLEQDSLKIVKICQSKEMMIKSGKEFYAVISTIKNTYSSDTHLGKLEVGTTYVTTDGLSKYFSVDSNGNIDCR